ncbi:rpsU-divergently transcribed protein [Radiomyces spectabilis]|uniref:rpsU-divergently transcribed protein n=1 Tax=Radiomyces spectabilis TaxID=64574 RepID=UPI00221EEA34|nr:rpsU-divergently transcribed protein [Radiomyces spectabilis]KAI8391818.1 rpsU-divergently transcribed protein [Radiomyces spectabilis]
MLKATLPFVPSHGWSMESIALGAKSLGYPSVAHGVFPGGEAGLIDAFLKDCRREFVARIAELQASGKLEGLSMTEKVRELTAMRLMMMKPYIRRWPEALAVMGRPSNVSSSLLHLGEIADDVWYYAGDRSPDMRWYSKRASLSAIYSATEVYMTQDISPNYQETLRFLDRRLNDAAWLGACAGQRGGRFP